MKDKIIYTKLTAKEVEDIQPLLERTNRDLKNFVHSLILCAIRVNKSGNLFDLGDLGKIIKNNK